MKFSRLHLRHFGLTPLTQKCAAEIREAFRAAELPADLDIAMKVEHFAFKAGSWGKSDILVLRFVLQHF